MADQLVLYLDPRRDARNSYRAQLLSAFNDDEFPEGTDRFPAMVPWAWCEPAAPERSRSVFTVGREEVFHLTELYYSALCLMIEKRAPVFAFHANTSDATPEQRQSAEGGANDTNTDFEQRKEELSKELNAQDVVGLDPASDEPSGMKVIVFRTAKIPGATLEAFLTTSEQLGDSPRLHYVFASSTSPLKNPVPATTKESFRTLGKSPFLKKSTNECIEAWHEMIEPLLECRSMIATHCFVVLDETTAKGQNLVKVVAFIPDGSGDFCTRYVSFAALSTGLLKGLEMLTVDLRMFGLDERNVVMEDAWGLTEWEVEEDVVEVSEGS